MIKLGNYDGGKGNMYQRLINLMPPHQVYVEPFIGGGSVMLRKRPARVNVGIDADVEVVAAWREWVSRIAENGGTEASPVVAVGAATGENGDAALAVLPGVLVKNGDVDWQMLRGDALTWLEAAVLPADVLIYADPPYLQSTRAGDRDLYRHEMKSEAEHRRLLDVLLGLDCMVMVSGYWADLYGDMLTGWETAVFPAYTRSGRAVEEWVWMNYPKPDSLHDYQYLGDDYRERERIRRKVARWTKKLAGLPVLERRAILRAIEGTDGR